MNKEEIKKVLQEEYADNFIKKIKMLFLDSTRFFDLIREERMLKTLEYLLIMLLIQLAIIFALTPPSAVALFLANLMLSVVMIFLFPALIQLFIMLLKISTHEHYQLTLKTVIYAATPYVLLGWIPYIRTIATIWMWYLLVKGLSVYYNISKKKAFVLTVLPFILLIAVFSILSMT